MADSGSLEHIESLDGGAVLRLRGNATEERSGTLRVYAGPRGSQPESGIVAAYTNGVNLAKLFATPRFEGRLVLSAVALEEDGDAFVERPIDLVHLGCSGEGPDRAGFLQISTVKDGEGQVIASLQAEGEQRDRGRLALYDASRGGRAAVLAVDDDGPYLRLTNGRGGALTISNLGIVGEPDKGLLLAAPHPDDARLRLCYSVLEGPEVGLYCRGTIRLEDGRGRAAIPDHFRHLASDAGLTAQLTPRSIDSLGVAVIELTTEQIGIGELHGGRGSYEVDYLVQGMRKGREDFAVVRRVEELPGYSREGS